MKLFTATLINLTLILASASAFAHKNMCHDVGTIVHETCDLQVVPWSNGQFRGKYPGAVGILAHKGYNVFIASFGEKPLEDGDLFLYPSFNWKKDNWLTMETTITEYRESEPDMILSGGNVIIRSHSSPKKFCGQTVEVNTIDFGPLFSTLKNCELE